MNRLLSYLLESISLFSARNSKKVVAVSILLTIIGAFFASKLEINTKPGDLLPKEMPSLQAYKEITQDFGRGEFIIAVMEAPPGAQILRYTRFISAYKKKIHGLKAVQDTQFDVSSDRVGNISQYIQRYALMLLDPSDLKTLNARLVPKVIKDKMSSLKLILGSVATSPSDPLNLTSLMEKLYLPANVIGPDPTGEYLITKGDKVAFFVVGSRKSAGHLRDTKLFLKDAKRIEDEAWNEFVSSRKSQSKELERPSVSLIGPHTILLEDTIIYKSISFATTVLTLIGCVIVFLLFFRRWRAIPFAYVPLLMSIVCCFGLTQLIIGSLNVITIGIGGMLIGLCDDFSIYLLNSFYQKRARGEDLLKALGDSYRHTGTAVVYAAVTCCGTFAIMIASNFKSFRELGIMTSIGIFLALVFVLFLLPAMLALADKSQSGSGILRYPSSFIRLPLLRPRLVAIVCLILFFGFGFFINKLDFESPHRTISRTLHATTNKSLKALERFSHSVGMSTTPFLIVVEGKDWEEALERNDQLTAILRGYRQSKEIGFIDSLSNWLPSQLRQKESLAKLEELPNVNPELFRKHYEDAVSSRMDEDERYLMYEGIVEKALASREMTSRDSLFSSGLGEMLNKYVKLDEGMVKLATSVYLPASGDYSQLKELLIAKLSEERPFKDGWASAPSEAEIVGNVQSLIVHDVTWIGFGIVAIIALTLWSCFSSWKLSLVSLLPTILGGVAVLGTYALIQGSFSVINILWLPIYVGLAVDDAIQIGTQLQSRGTLEGALEECGGGVILSSLTTMIGFGVWIVMVFPLMRQAGLLVFTALGWELFASLIFLPAILKILIGKRILNFDMNK